MARGLLRQTLPLKPQPKQITASSRRPAHLIGINSKIAHQRQAATAYARPARRRPEPEKEKKAGEKKDQAACAVDP